MAMTHAQAVRGPSRLDPVGRDPAPSISPLGSAECDMAVTHARAVRGPGRRDPARRDPAPSLSLLGSADSSTAATHAWALRGPSRARPGGEGPCSLPLAARHSRQLHGRDTRARRCAARARRDPAGRGPAPSLSLLGTADSPMAATHAQGGARLQPGETRRGRALLSSLSLSAEPTASRPRHTHRRCAARAGRDQAWEGSALSLLLLGISLLC